MQPVANFDLFIASEARRISKNYLQDVRQQAQSKIEHHVQLCEQHHREQANQANQFLIQRYERKQRMLKKRRRKGQQRHYFSYNNNNNSNSNNSNNSNSNCNSNCNSNSNNNSHIDCSNSLDPSLKSLQHIYVPDSLKDYYDEFIEKIPERKENSIYNENPLIKGINLMNIDQLPLYDAWVSVRTDFYINDTTSQLYVPYFGDRRSDRKEAEDTFVSQFNEYADNYNDEDDIYIASDSEIFKMSNKDSDNNEVQNFPKRRPLRYDQFYNLENSRARQVERFTISEMIRTHGQDNDVWFTLTKVFNKHVSNNFKNFKRIKNIHLISKQRNDQNTVLTQKLSSQNAQTAAIYKVINYPYSDDENELNHFYYNNYNGSNSDDDNVLRDDINCDDSNKDNDLNENSITELDSNGENVGNNRNNYESDSIENDESDLEDLYNGDDPFNVDNDEDNNENTNQEVESSESDCYSHDSDSFDDEQESDDNDADDSDYVYEGNANLNTNNNNNNSRSNEKSKNNTNSQKSSGNRRKKKRGERRRPRRTKKSSSRTSERIKRNIASSTLPNNDTRGPQKTHMGSAQASLRHFCYICHKLVCELHENIYFNINPVLPIPDKTVEKRLREMYIYDETDRDTERKSKFKPCNRRCFVYIYQAENDGDIEMVEDNEIVWKYEEIILFREARSLFGDDWCNVSKIIKTKNCQQVYKRASNNLPEDSEEHRKKIKEDSDNGSNKSKSQKKKNDQFLLSSKLRAKRASRRNNVSKKQSSKQSGTYENKCGVDDRVRFIPCNHEGVCSKKNKCRCAINKTPCETTCGCNNCRFGIIKNGMGLTNGRDSQGRLVICPRRRKGCRCKPPATCSTNQCPCYKNTSACDPDLCEFCDCPILPSFIGIDERRCRNSDLITGRHKRILIGRSTIHGFGLFAAQHFKPGELLGPYCGRIASYENLDRSIWLTQAKNLTYAFDATNEMAVDASFLGCKVKFINHDDAELINCESRVERIRGEYKICVKAIKPICPGQELLMDYRINHDEGNKWITNSGGNDGADDDDSDDDYFNAPDTMCDEEDELFVPRRSGLITK